MKTKLLTTLSALASLLLCACTTTAQVPPANSVEVKQRNASGDGWEFVSLTPQPDSALTFGTDRKPATTTLATFARASDLTLLNSTVGTLQTQLTTNTGKITTAESNITALQTSVAGKEAAGVAASLLTAHTAATNPHTQYALASVLANYATLTVLNSATDSLTTAINAKAPLAHTHAQADITGLAVALAAKLDTSDSRLHTHTNKSTLDKITESAGLPLWNGATWPGGSTGGSYTLPPATATTLGGIKVGANLSITADGTLSAASGGGAGLPLTGNGVGIANPTEGKLAISAEFFDTNSSDLTTIRSQTRTEIFANESIKLQSNEGITLVSHGGQFLFNAEALMDFKLDDADGWFSFNRPVRGVPAVGGNDFVTKAQLDAATGGSGQSIAIIPRIGNTFTLDANADVCIINQPDSDYEYMRVVIPSNRKQGALVLIINNTDGIDGGVYHFQQTSSPYGYRGSIRNSNDALASGDSDFTLYVVYGARLDFFWHGNVMSVTGCVFQ